MKTEPHIRLLRPDELSAKDLDSLAAFVRVHGRVPPERVRANLAGAFAIAVADIAGQTAGLSCLKVPRPAYLEDLCRRTGLNLRGFLERGYTCVAPDFRGRGLARRLTSSLQRAAGERPFYVLAGAEDPIIDRLLQDTGMARLLDFDSRKAGRRLALWVNANGRARLGLK